MADSAPVTVWASGTDKACNFFNKPWLAFTGRSLEQELSNGCSERVHSEDLDRCLQIYMSSFDARSSFQMEYRLRRFDGDYRWVLSTGGPRFDHNGVFAGHIGSCIDITGVRPTEEDVAKQKLRPWERWLRALPTIWAIFWAGSLLIRRWR